MIDREDVLALFGDYASATISAEQLRILESALRDDKELRLEFIEYLNLDAALGDLAALTGVEIAEMDMVGSNGRMMPVNGNSAWMRGRFIAIVGAVAATILVAASLWTASPVAEVVTAIDVSLKTSGHKAWDESTLPAGAYKLERGLLHLRFHGGVMVYLEAPARFDVADGKRIVLHRGRVSANVPPEGIGFTVETSEATIVDYGTEFSVDAESGTSEVHVFDGLVRVHSRHEENEVNESIDLRTAEAILIRGSQSNPTKIKLAAERFIRDFEEPKRNYATSVKQFAPIAYYRMPIRDRGLVSEPAQYSGEVLTDSASIGGSRPPHARGIFAGGSLRVKADSIGRGGRVDYPPPLSAGQFAIAVFVYLETRLQEDATIATNIHGSDGNFALTLDENGLLRATVRQSDGELRYVTSDRSLPIANWCHVVITADSDLLTIYVDGQLVASTSCATMAAEETATLWFGTSADGKSIWDGRIDELALFDRAFTDADVRALYQAGRKEVSKAE